VAKRRPRRSAKKTAGGRKGLIRLIKSVALSTAETKRYQAFFAPFNYITSTGSSYKYLQHFISDLPNVRNSATASDTSYIGDTIFLKGVKWRFTMTWDSHNTTTPGTAIYVRISLLSGTNINDGNVLYPTLIGEHIIPPTFYEPTSLAGMPTTTQRWNTNRVKVHRTKKFVIRPMNEKTALSTYNLYMPFNRKMKTSTEESNISTNTFGLRANGKQYWWALEMFNPNGGELDEFSGGPRCEKIIYFKDA